jgi:hypothetical protein
VNRLQKRNQLLIRSALRQQSLIKTVNLTRGHLIEIEQISWEDYWSNTQGYQDQLHELHCAWIGFRTNESDLKHKKRFVHAYFSLLKQCIRGVLHGNADMLLLSLLVSFETFEICDGMTNAAAGLLSNRNPAYLLSRLANPHAPADPKYLPVVKPVMQSKTHHGLFYHYRRIALESFGGAQLFIYPPDDPTQQAISHAFIGRFFKSLTPRTDPWVRERTKSLFDGVFSQILDQCEEERLELLDIACGSGRISVEICKRASDHFRKSFGLTLLDVTHSNRSLTTTFYQNPNIFHGLSFHHKCLFEWLQTALNNKRNHFDIGLMLRVLDLYNQFQIECLNHSELAASLHGLDANATLFADLTNPAKLIARERCQDISHSIGRMNLVNAWTYEQLSLSDYFRALAIVSGQEALAEDVVYAAVRRFDESCLLTPDQDSLISKLMRITDRLIIEDMDVTTERLHKHIERYNLTGLRVRNVAKHRQSHRACVSLIEKCE